MPGITTEKKRGLGRNLNALLSQTKSIKDFQENDTDAVLKKLPIEQLRPGKYQPRKHIPSETLEELAGSIRQQGILQPIVVRTVGYEQYEIIAGERRWRAAQLAELKQVPVLVYVVSDQKALALALIENIQREDLNPIEEAYALHRLIEEFGLTHQQTAEAVGKSRTNVTNTLRLLNLNSRVKLLLEERKLEMGHARALLMLPSERQSLMAEVVVAKKLSVRETERLVKQQPKKKPSSTKQVNDPNLMDLQRKLSDQLGAKVVFNHGMKGAGHLIIYYNSLNELDGIVEHMT